MSNNSKGFIKDFFSEGGSPSGYYVSMALYSVYKELKTLLKTLVDIQIIGKLASFTTLIDTMVDAENRYKKYSDFKRAMDKLNITSDEVAKNATSLAVTLGNILSDKCYKIEGKVNGLGLYIPDFKPCTSFYFNPRQSESLITKYPENLKNAVIQIARSSRLSEIFEKNVISMVKHYKEELESSSESSPADLASALNIINTELVTDQLINYLKKVKDDMEILVGYVLKLQLLTLPQTPKKSYVNIYNKYRVEDSDNILTVAGFAQDHPQDLLTILNSKNQELYYTPDFFNNNRLSDIGKYIDDLRSMVDELETGEEKYIGDPLFAAFYLLSSEPDCEDCRTMADLITLMSPQQREDAIAEIPGVKPLSIELSDSPYSVMNLLQFNSNLSYYFSVATNNQKIIPALTNLIKYINVKKILSEAANRISASLTSIVYSPPFADLIRDFNYKISLDTLQRLGKSWMSLDQQIININLAFQDIFGEKGVDNFVESMLARVIKDGQEVEITSTDLSFEDLKLTGFYSAGKKISEEPNYIVYETAVGRVYLTKSANWFYETFKRSWSLDRMVEEVKKLYMINDNTIAMKVVEIFTNALLRSGAIVLKAAGSGSTSFTFTEKKEGTKVL
ncbi:MAG: hypothetical protein ACP5LF_05685 [Nitrososphaeria archaeon]